MNKEKALKNQGLEFREDINKEGGESHMVKWKRSLIDGAVMGFLGLVPH